MKKDEIIVGIAKILKFSEIPNPRLKRNPAANGPITAPNLPAPIDQPMPVFLNLWDIFLQPRHIDLQNHLE